MTVGTSCDCSGFNYGAFRATDTVLANSLPPKTGFLLLQDSKGQTAALLPPFSETTTFSLGGIRADIRNTR